MHFKPKGREKETRGVKLLGTDSDHHHSPKPEEYWHAERAGKKRKEETRVTNG